MENNTFPEINDEDSFVLQLYVSGMSQKSMQAIKNIKHLCNEYFKSDYKLEIIDIYKYPEVAIQQQIIFSPSLIKCRPLPKKILVGDFSDADKVIKALGIPFKK